MKEFSVEEISQIVGGILTKVEDVETSQEVPFEINIDNDDEESEEHSSHDENIEHKREIVMKWLDSDLELHSTLAYELFPDKVSNDTKKGEARSLFSKKYRGHDDTGKPYSFDDDEINTLYNLRNKYIKQRGFDKK